MISLDISIRAKWSARLRCEETIHVSDGIDGAIWDKMAWFPMKTVKYVTIGETHYMTFWEPKRYD